MFLVAVQDCLSHSINQIYLFYVMGTHIWPVPQNVPTCSLSFVLFAALEQ